MRNLQLPIRTERLLLREFTSEDLAGLHAFSSDPRVTRYLFFGPRDEEASARYLEDLLASQQERPRTRFELAVEELLSGRLIGACDLSLIERDVVDLGYMLGTPDWGRARDLDGRRQQRGLDAGTRKSRHALGGGLPQAPPREESLVGLSSVHPAARRLGGLARAAGVLTGSSRHVCPPRPVRALWFSRARARRHQAWAAGGAASTPRRRAARRPAR